VNPTVATPAMMSTCIHVRLATAFEARQAV
jgi:hypothetical protein